jgi:hypothetical protein
VESAGDVPLPGVGQLEDMLIVNKDRLFLENVGAVRELSKVFEKGDEMCEWGLPDGPKGPF